MSDVTLKSSIVSVFQAEGHVSGIRSGAFHHPQHLILRVKLEDDYGVAVLDSNTCEIVWLLRMRADLGRSAPGKTRIWAILGHRPAVLWGDECYLWPEMSGGRPDRIAVANPEHFADDPMVLADAHRRRPDLLQLQPLGEGRAVALFSDNFYKAGGRYLARLELRDGALHWGGPLQQIDEKDVLERWTERTFSLHETPLIQSIHARDGQVACVTRGGTATMLNHGPAYQTNLVATYGLPDPEPASAGGDGRRGGLLGALFGRKPAPPAAPPSPGFVLRNIVERPLGTVFFSADGSYEAVWLDKTNKVALYRPGAAEPFAQLSLTPKQNLGELKPGKVSLAFNGPLMAVIAADRVHFCRLEGLEAARGQ
ncbi:hypothetical protein ACLBXM_22670 [Xanthobacteraceae bacterium A53D]